VSSLVGDESGRDSGGGRSGTEGGTNAADQGLPAAMSRQEELSGWLVSLRTEQSQALDDVADKRIHRDEAIPIELSDGDVNGPLIRPERAETVRRQVDALANAHAGVTLQQQQVAEEVVATAQFLLQQLVLLGEQWAGKDLIAARDIFSRKQMGQGGNLFAPGQFFQQAVQIDDADGERGFGQRRHVRT